MVVKINTDNASFHSEGDMVLDSYIMAEQLNAIFRNIVSKIRDGADRGSELDVNGNSVCSWEV